MLSIFLLGAFSFVFVSSVYAVTVPSGTITDPTVQGYPGCTPGNCAVQSSSSSSLPTATMYGQVVVWDGSAWVATTTLTASTTAATTTLNLTAVVGATSTGIFFLDANGKLSQDTDNFNYNPVTKKLTLTGGLDPLWVQAKDSTTFGGAYFEAYDGNNAGVSLANTGRLRYSTSTQAWEVSTNGGAYAPIVVSGSNIVLSNATITNATITNAVITNGTSTNFFATLFSAITGIFHKLVCNKCHNYKCNNYKSLGIKYS
jgi:hypothetical protein